MSAHVKEHEVAKISRALPYGVSCNLIMVLGHKTSRIIAIIVDIMIGSPK